MQDMQFRVPGRRLRPENDPASLYRAMQDRPFLVFANFRLRQCKKGDVVDYLYLLVLSYT
jgi:hypothetical protein